MNYFIFDGAMGTMLQKENLPEEYCPELANIEKPEIIQKIHQAYIEAGSNIITTNTFGASSIKLEDYGLEDRTEEINIAAVRVAKKAIEDSHKEVKIAGDMGPTGKFIYPMGDLAFDDAVALFKEQAQALLKGGVDYLLIETIIDIQEMRAALLGAKDACEQLGKKIPIICQLSYTEDGRTITGTSPQVAVILLEAMGADIIGANCSLGPEQLLPLVEEMAAVTNLPIILQPNAGMPKLVGKETIFPLSPEEMASFVPALMDAGVTYLGACCGSTPEHIKAIAHKAASHTPKERAYVKPFTAITSRTQIVRVGQQEKPIIIGERINPTGRKALAADIKEGNFITVKKDALAQVEAGADVLDVNMGVPGTDPAETMAKAITEISMLVEVPLSIDTIDAAALEAGLKAYPGRALINSVNAEKEQIESVMPLAKRYGAALLCLPLGNGQLPQKAEDRCTLAKNIVLEAYSYGIRPQDLLLDPLVLTLAAGQDSAKETLRTLDLYKTTFGFPTVMGLSNISFGLPQRPYLNAQFLTMALTHGLTAPILNPMNGPVKKAFVAATTLLGYDPAAMNFIHQYGDEEEVIIKKSSDKEHAKSHPLTPLEAIQHAVEQGEKELVVELVEKALDERIPPLDITEKALSQAMEVIGEKFGARKVFLPQVMLAAEAMQSAFQTIKKKLPQEKGLEKGTVILATVKGDIHDLGKNIVSALLENNGYKIIDLGKDVSPEAIVEAKERHVDAVVGLCSLMTTTMPQIDIAIDCLRKLPEKTKVIVGGAVLTQEYANQAGADSYAKDAVSAVQLVNQLLERE